MAWWNDYDLTYRNYRGNAGGYDRGAYGTYGSPYGGYGYGGRYGYGGYGGYDRGYGYGGYGREYAVAPERSPTYGQAGDQAAQRYARSHGYDTGYAIRPDANRGWRTGGYANERIDYRGRPAYGSYGGYRGYGGGYDRGFRYF